MGAGRNTNVARPKTSGILIPDVKLVDLTGYSTHANGDNIGDISSAQANNVIKLGLYFDDAYDLEFTKHKPKYLMETIRARGMQTERAINPASYIDGADVSIRNLNAIQCPYGNLNNGGVYQSLNNKSRPTWWNFNDLNPNSYTEIIIDPSTWFKFGTDGGADFMPIEFDFWHNRIRHRSVAGTGVVGEIKSLYFKFRIAIENPFPGNKNDGTKRYSPEYGESYMHVKIYPRLGTFAEGRYFYEWRAEILL